MSRFYPRAILATIVIVLSSTLSVTAQVAGDLRGRILDATGAVVPGASVELTRP